MQTNFLHQSHTDHHRSCIVDHRPESLDCAAEGRSRSLDEPGGYCRDNSCQRHPNRKRELSEYENM
jgi:hypothetical protein